MYKILLIEDDEALAKAMKGQLENYDNEVHVIENLRQVIEEFTDFKPHIVLMDIMLPYKDGYYWCSEIRKISTVPVVFISSASDNMNIVMAINMGGDDFIAKPVDPMVLNAKVQAVLRRTYEIAGKSDKYEFNGAVLNVNDGSFNINGKKIELTKNEFRILQTLLDSRGKIVSRDALMLKLWENDLYVEENTLTVNVSRLRKKLEEQGMENVIQTKPGSGYIIS